MKEYLPKKVLLDSSLNAVCTVLHLDHGHILDICEISDSLVIHLSLLWSLKYHYFAQKKHALKRSFPLIIINAI